LAIGTVSWGIGIHGMDMGERGRIIQRGERMREDERVCHCYIA
jgi:hypothetical protein